MGTLVADTPASLAEAGTGSLRASETEATAGQLSLHPFDVSQDAAEKGLLPGSFILCPLVPWEIHSLTRQLLSSQLKSLKEPPETPSGKGTGEQTSGARTLHGEPG